MKYKAFFCKAWVGSWVFEAIKDLRAWETAILYVKEHREFVIVEVSEIWELNKLGDTVRKLDDYEDYFILYKVHYDGGECILKIDRDKDDFSVWNKAIRDIKKDYGQKVNRIDELDKTTFSSVRRLERCTKSKKNRTNNPNKIDPSNNKEKQEEVEQAYYKAYFSNGECSGPYIVDVSENDTVAIVMANLKLEQYGKYTGTDITNIKVVKIKELNESKLFTVNNEREISKNDRFIYIKESAKAHAKVTGLKKTDKTLKIGKNDNLTIIYQDSNNVQTERHITPCGIKNDYYGEDAIQAYCHLRNSMRAFKLSGIQKAVLNGKEIDIHELLNIVPSTIKTIDNNINNGTGKLLAGLALDVDDAGI